MPSALANGLTAVEAACSEAHGEGVHSAAAIILNILGRARECLRTDSIERWPGKLQTVG